MLRKDDLIKLLAEIDGNPVIAVYDGLAMLVPIRLAKLEHDNLRLFQMSDTVIIAPDEDARQAELVRIGYTPQH